MANASYHDVRVERTNEGVAVHITGPRAAQINAEQLASCFDTLLSCADENACFEKGLGVQCLETVIGHHRETGCITSAFGLSGRSAAASS